VLPTSRIFPDIFTNVSSGATTQIMVPAPEKIVLLFETHTDIIVTGCRETAYGYILFLTGGASNLILDCLIERSNPTDAERFLPLLDRHILRYCRTPRKSTVDGGLASQANPAV
jgi:IS5 family transposase